MTSTDVPTDISTDILLWYKYWCINWHTMLIQILIYQLTTIWFNWRLFWFKYWHAICHTALIHISLDQMCIKAVVISFICLFIWFLSLFHLFLYVFFFLDQMCIKAVLLWYTLVLVRAPDQMSNVYQSRY